MKKFALLDPLLLPDVALDALELAELPAGLAALRGGVVASADCDLRGFCDFGVPNFGALKRAISLFISAFVDFRFNRNELSDFCAFSNFSSSFCKSTFFPAIMS